MEKLTKPLISVIIPVYNAEKHIIETLMSLESQEFKNFEVILVNDGSKDNSFKIAKEYLKKNEMNYKLLEQKNKGVSSARNAGLKAALGAYITFIDADDIFHPSHLKEMYNGIIENNVKLSICRSKSFEKLTEIADRDNVVNNSGEVLKVERLMWVNLVERFHVGMGYFLVNAKLIKQNNVLFAEGYKWDEDYHFLWQILLNIDSIYIINSYLHYYRQTPGSVMTQFNKERFKSLNLYLDINNRLKNSNHDFKDVYDKFGVARWFWSTLWQASTFYTYKEFKKISVEFNSKKWLKKLRGFPDKRVRFSSRLYCINKYLFYSIARFMAKASGVSRN